jgi:lipid A 3-O-deacylase
VAQPRPHIGGLLNTAGATSQGYFGLTWQATVARGLIHKNNGLFFEVFAGGAVNDGYANSPRSDRKSLGSNLLFRIGTGVGFQVTPQLSVLAVLDHESNAGLAAHNPGLNNVGLQIGYRF